MVDGRQSEISRINTPLGISRREFFRLAAVGTGGLSLGLAIGRLPGISPTVNLSREYDVPVDFINGAAFINQDAVQRALESGFVDRVFVNGAIINAGVEVAVNTLLDPGARFSTCPTGVAAKLKINKIGTMNVTGVTGSRGGVPYGIAEAIWVNNVDGKKPLQTVLFMDMEEDGNLALIGMSFGGQRWRDCLLPSSTSIPQP